MSTGSASREVLHSLINDVPPSGKSAQLLSATALTVLQQQVKMTANTATDSYIVTLPNVVEAAGLVFSFVSVIANSKVITLTDAGDDSNFVDLTFDTNDDAALLYSDGQRWWVLVNDIA